MASSAKVAAPLLSGVESVCVPPDAPHGHIPQDLNHFFAAVFPELRRMGRRLLCRERPDPALESTILADEVFLQLVVKERRTTESVSEFFALAGLRMRQILIDRARRRRTLRRGGRLNQFEPVDAIADRRTSPDIESVVVVGDLIARLMALDERAGRVVELAFFFGLDDHEIAEQLNVGLKTVARDRAFARAWLYANLYPGCP